MNLAYKLDLDMVKLNHCVSVKGQLFDSYDVNTQPPAAVNRAHRRCGERLRCFGQTLAPLSTTSSRWLLHSFMKNSFELMQYQLSFESVRIINSCITMRCAVDGSHDMGPPSRGSSDME